MSVYQVQMGRPADGSLDFLWKEKEWLTMPSMQSVSLPYAEGWCEGRRSGELPCPALRVVRVRPPTNVIDKVVLEYPEISQLRTGMMPVGIGHQWRYILQAVEKGLLCAKTDAEAAPFEPGELSPVNDLVYLLAHLQHTRRKFP